MSSNVPERAAEESGGTLRVVAADDELAAAARVLGAELARAGERVSRPFALAGREGFLKGGPLAGRAGLRHGCAAVLMRRPAPRLCELANLRWLRERLFEAPEPLAAGVLTRRGLPRYQFLVTELVPASRTLETFLEAPGEDGERSMVLGELARELARMHALGFVHHDLFLRNVLVRDAPSAGRDRRIVFLDAWAGGPAPRLRGPAYDLGCLLLELPELANEDEVRALLAGYLEARAAQDAPANAATLMRRAARVRRALARGLERDPGRLRGRPAPRRDWLPPTL